MKKRTMKRRGKKNKKEGEVKEEEVCSYNRFINVVVGLVIVTPGDKSKAWHPPSSDSAIQTTSQIANSFTNKTTFGVGDIADARQWPCWRSCCY